MAGFASTTGMPSKGPLLTIRPPSLSVNGSDSGVVALAPSPATTRTIGSPNAVANSKSRSSCPGTAMIAPVPYSIST
jgi:hypothetical protein